MKGRPPDPNRERRGTGNRPQQGEAKVARRDTAPVQSGPVVPPAPASLPAQVHGVWSAVCADLGAAGHLRPAYLPQIEAYCQAVFTHAAATAGLHAHGMMVRGPNGPVTNPMVRVQKDAAAVMLRYAEQLGLTPAARIRLAVVEVAGASMLATLNQRLDGKG